MIGYSSISNSFYYDSETEAAEQEYSTPMHTPSLWTIQISASYHPPTITAILSTVTLWVLRLNNLNYIKKNKNRKNLAPFSLIIALTYCQLVQSLRAELSALLWTVKLKTVWLAGSVTFVNSPSWLASVLLTSTAHITKEQKKAMKKIISL